MKFFVALENIEFSKGLDGEYAGCCKAQGNLAECRSAGSIST